ncbi:helix-turn-helix domain-containing protein [Patulibacter sp. SYSU D01012]|uniref:helix-turn-helix domain-containing protein n=1 Tax=Patulibacter sp. SYSU D01012 TaxID=2817381 RepID=UPI001B31136E|nr:helix-turn-helix domain-containing protein [Patulibacter sp. SYSU D01012]
MSDYPFKHAGPVPPRRMIDREDERRRLGRAAAERTPVRLAAPRRYGKTTLLAAHAAALEAAGWRTVRADLGGISDLAGLTRALLVAWAGHREAAPVRRVERLAGRIGADVSLAGPRLTLAPAGATPADHGRLLEELLALPDAVARSSGEPVLVILDEFQDLLVAGPGLDARLRAVIQPQQDVAYVFAGSEPSLIARMFERHEAPFFGQAEPLSLPPLPLESTIDEVERRFAELALDPGDAAATLVQLGEGHPQRTMLLCHLLARRLTEPGVDGDEDAHVAAVLEEALEQTAEIHAAALAPLTRLQRIVLGEVAHGRAPTSADLARRQGATRGAFHQALEALIEAGQLLARDPGPRWRLIDPLLRLRLRR